MSRPVLEVVDIFRDHGAAWRRANVGHVSLDQMNTDRIAIVALMVECADRHFAFRSENGSDSHLRAG